jgi:hypothetical protein
MVGEERNFTVIKQVQLPSYYTQYDCRTTLSPDLRPSVWLSEPLGDTSVSLKERARFDYDSLFTT